VRYVRKRREAGVEDFVQLIKQLTVEEADALAEAVTALQHLQRLDEERRSASPASIAGGEVR
jgi:hypothetical protein